MPCAVCQTNKAMLDLGSGIFLPCHQCQSLGWGLDPSWPLEPPADGFGDSAIAAMSHFAQQAGVSDFDDDLLSPAAEDVIEAYLHYDDEDGRRAPSTTKKTQVWCKGVVGRSHMPIRLPYNMWRDRILPGYIEVCDQCGKRLRRVVWSDLFGRWLYRR